MTVYQNGDSLIVEVFDKILSREITTFASLLEWLGPVKAPGNSRNIALSKGYNLIKKLYWGVFKDLNPKDYPVLWNQIAIQNTRYRTAGDLKRSLSISNIFISLLDIHGYTAFCRQSKKNISKLHELDEFLSTSIKNIAKTYGCIGNRERGDEILLVAGSALDALQATCEIIQVFAKEIFFSSKYIEKFKTEINNFLPKFNISAGISGGNLNTPMIITQKGEISGFLLNVAARLQSRANKLSPKATKVIIAKTVQTSFEREVKKNHSPDFTSSLAFLDNGQITFKGTSIANLEVIFKQKNKFKLNYESALAELLTSLKRNSWKDRILMDLLQLISKVNKTLPSFSLKVILPSLNDKTVTNDIIRQKINVIKNLFTIHEDYIGTLERLQELIYILKKIPDFEPLAIEYATEIIKRYEIVIPDFKHDLDKIIEENKSILLSPDEVKVYDYLIKNQKALTVLINKTRRSPNLPKKRMLWHTHIEMKKNQLDFSLFSGKQ